MKNTTNNKTSIDSHQFAIALDSITALNNPTLNDGDYWNLSGVAYGSGTFHDAWKYATGRGVTIGIVDEGVNSTHLDLAASYNSHLDYDPRDTTSHESARPDSNTETHGTEVAGIIAGSATNTFGTIGAAPDATIAASYLRFDDFSIGDVAQIMAHQTAYDVSNNSWGFTGAFADNFEDPYFADVAAGIANAASNGRDGLGTAMVFAAGNGKLTIDGQNEGDDSNFHNLSNSRYVIAVGAHDDTGESAFFSSPGTNVLLSAPGIALLTTTGDEYHSKDSTYASGTSFAAPMVASAIALMLQVNPHLGYRDIQEILAISSDPSRSGETTANGATNVNGGGLVFDREMGFGALNAEAAVNLARSWTGVRTAANEQHLAANFALPIDAGPHQQVMTLDLTNAGIAGFSLEHAQLHLAVDDADLTDLRIELTSPDGTTAVIAPNLEAAAGRPSLDFTFSSVETWGENPYGTWTLTLTHPGSSSAFDVTAADLDLYGDATGTSETYYFTGAFARLVAGDPSRATIHDTDGGLDRLNFAAATAAATVDLALSNANKLGNTAFHLDGQFERVFGSTYNDHISGSADANSIQGDYGNDWINGRAGNDVLSGGAGNDTIYGGGGADTIDGGAGVDTVSFTQTVSINFATGVNAGEAAGDVYLHVERFSLSSESDTFRGSLAAINDSIMGNGGSDMLDGGAGNDWLDGGKGNDTLLGGAGNDNFVVDSPRDRVIERSGEGHDTVHASVSYALTANVEDLVLTGAASIGRGNGADNEISGDAGANYLLGAAGNDTLRGGAGNDILDGGAGKNVLAGGLGNDTYVLHSTTDIVTEGYGQGHDIVRAHVNYSLSVNLENLVLLGWATIGHGNGLANSIAGDAVANHLYGASGNDTLIGNAGNDYLSGDTGRDRLDGGVGSDTLLGGAGSDTLTGGVGNDRFVFRTASDSSRSSRDLITDFRHNTDRIDVRGIDANLHAAGNNAFDFIGNGTTHHAGEIGFRFSGNNTLITGETNGDGHADLLIVLSGHHALTASDFIL